MKTIHLDQPSLEKDWSMVFMDGTHYDHVINESVKIYKPDGSPLLVLLKQAIPFDMAAQAWQALKRVNTKTENRGVASGIKPSYRKKLDGTISNTTQVAKGWEVKSAVLGYFERTVRMPYAHAAAWNQKRPTEFSYLFPMLQTASDHFREQVPDRFAVQADYAARTNPNWIIPGTVYSTLTVNKNFRTAAHLDAGDLAAGFSNMIVLRDGKFLGGHLVLPNWRLAVQLDNLDLVMFDAHEFHGNTMIVPIGKKSVRCSIVCYYRENLIKCKSPEEELYQAKNRKLGQPLFWEAP
jgi:hypothetical protein